MVEEIKCVKCENFKDVADFRLNRTQGRVYRRVSCKGCEDKARVARMTPEYNQKRTRYKISNPASNQKLGRRLKAERLNPIFRPKYILIDSRRSDQRYKRENDLDIEWITEAIKGGCSYCGDTTLMITLDRIDNKLGHTKKNVASACIRCNLIRGSMPYAAWIEISKSVRKAEELRLFGEWTGSIQCKTHNGRVGHVPSPPVSKTDSVVRTALIG